MSGISTGVGLFSGMDTQSLIQQLLQVESRPKILAQRRVIQLQQTQAAYLDLNSKLSALKTAAGAFRVNNTFKTNKAVSTNPDAMTATASTAALPGQYTFIVDRLVSTQKLLSRGFASSTSGLNAGSFSFEPEVARLDRDISLSDLNGGQGVRRGKIIINQVGGGSATIDLTRAATVNDVLEAINSAEGIDVTASVEGGKFVLRSNTTGNLSVTSASGYDTAASLGIETTTPTGTTITGASVYSMNDETALAALNDGNGIFRHTGSGTARYDFQIVVGGTSVNINVGDKYSNPTTVSEAAPTTVGELIDRINAELATALGNSDVQIGIGADGASLQITDAQNRTIEVTDTSSSTGTTTATDLGIKTSAPATGTVAGSRILAGLNTTLARNLNGGSGVTAGAISITGRDGVSYNVTLDANATLADIVARFSTDTNGKITAALNENGTGLEITDATGGTGNLIISGAAAESLGIDTVPAGVASATVTGDNLQHRYVTPQTLLSSLRAGQGIGTGSIRLTDSNGVRTEITINDTLKTVSDLVKHINTQAGNRVRARINAKGDGVELYESSTGAGTQKIKAEDLSGSVAFNLNIKGEAAGTGADNVIDGSYERTITFAATDGLDKIVQKITAANVGIQASIINDGSGATPYRLSLTAKNTGSAGRVIIDSGAFDLGLNTLDRGQDARVFFGGTDPAHAVLLTSSRNTIDNVITGVSIDLNSPSTEPVTLTVSRDTAAIETAVNALVDSFNALVDRISTQTKYDKDNNTKGPLLGDSTTLQLSSNIFNTIQDEAQGLSGEFQTFAEVGLTIGQGGKLKLDRERLRAAMEEDFESVAELFAARELAPREPDPIPGVPGGTVNNPDAPDEFVKLGVAGLIEELANSYLNTVNGVLTRRNQAITDQIGLQNKRIAGIDARLATRRQVLERQFLAMEQAIGKLQSQQSALGQMSFMG